MAVTSFLLGLCAGIIASATALATCVWLTKRAIKEEIRKKIAEYDFHSITLSNGNKLRFGKISKELDFYVGEVVNPDNTMYGMFGFDADSCEMIDYANFKEE